MSVGLSICPSVRLHRTTRFPVDGFLWIVIFELFSKKYQENYIFVKIWQELRVLHMNTFSYLWQYLAEFFLEREMRHTKFIQKIRIHVLCSVTFFRKTWLLWDNVEKYGGARGGGWSYGGALRAGLLRLHARKHKPRPIPTPTNTRAYTHTHSPTRALMHVHTHIQKYIILIAFPLQQWLRERALILRYTYTDSLF